MNGYKYVRFDNSRRATRHSLSNAKAGGEEISPAAAPGELLTLSWEPLVALSAWHRGRASVLKFEISRGPGRPAEWTGFVPTAGLVHSPRSVFERAIPLTGRVGSEPPTSARTAASAGSRSRDDRPRVSLEVAMAFQPAFSSGPILDAAGNGRAQPVPTATPRTVAFSAIAPSPFHPDMRRIPPEAGELVVHCLRARNLRLPRNVELSPKLVLTAVPDGEEVETSTPNSGPGGRHPVWGQVRQRTYYMWLSVSDLTLLSDCTCGLAPVSLILRKYCAANSPPVARGCKLHR